jgi:hypothetical protein
MRKNTTYDHMIDHAYQILADLESHVYNLPFSDNMSGP